MHDGAPAHFVLAVREFLNDVLLQKRIGKDGPTAQPDPSRFKTSRFSSLGTSGPIVQAMEINDVQNLQR
jgi:hypothetical protein